MGSHFDNWDSVEGAIYMGANTSWEVIWVVAAAVCCVIALVVGSKHELDAYKKMDE